MREPDDYPVLYRTADASSNRLQSQHFTLVGGSLVVLIAAGAMSAFPHESSGWRIVAGVANLAVALATVWAMWSKPQARWYETRAVSESVKTIAWRYALRAQPFDISTKAARELLSARLASVLGEHKAIAADIPPSGAIDQVTTEMERIRDLPVQDRLAVYLTRRVEEQGSWYARRAADHRRTLWWLLGVFLFALGFTAVLMFVRAAQPETEMPYADVAMSCSMAILAWLQAKRLPDLIASYSLAAHEIGFVKMTATSVGDEGSLSKFVADAENAFSREHTQWVARLDQ